MGSSDVDFFIHSYYEFKLFGVTLSINTTMVTTVIVCLILLALILFARHEIMKWHRHGSLHRHQEQIHLFQSMSERRSGMQL